MPYLREVSAVWFKKELRNWNLQKQRICRENAVFVSLSCSFDDKNNGPRAVHFLNSRGLWRPDADGTEAKLKLRLYNMGRTVSPRYTTQAFPVSNGFSFHRGNRKVKDDASGFVCRTIRQVLHGQNLCDDRKAKTGTAISGISATIKFCPDF